MRIGLVAGEASGDLLGAGLIAAIKQRFPDAVFEGIAGPCMIEAGCRVLFPAEKLAVMGLIGLGQLRELYGIRQQLVAHFRAHPPDVFIGIDAPDFTLGVEKRLRAAGIRTVHYVSPSVWAWRRYRVRKIARSTDLMLTLFPFEAAFYETHHVPVRFVGHPLADMIPLDVSKQEARRALNLPEEGELIALLPGSRLTEVRMLGEVFLRAALVCAERRPGMRFITPVASPATRDMFAEYIAHVAPHLPITLVEGHSREVMAATDAILLASGTATLEAMLLKRPMVTAYRLAPFTYWLARRLVKVAHFALPNLLADRRLVPELLQDEVTPENLARALLTYFEQPATATALEHTFHDIHLQLRRDASAQAADAVIELCEGNK